MVDDERPHLDGEVEAELEALKGPAGALSAADLKGGGWFPRLLRSMLATYAQRVDAAYFAGKYPHLPADAVAARRIALAQRYAAIEGGLSAAAYSGAIALTLGSVGGASPLTIPAAITAFGLDLLYTSRLQLRLAYDLSVLYRSPIDIDDPEDLYDLFRVAFGVRVGEALRGGVTKLAPEAARVGVKAALYGARLHAVKGLPVVGKLLLQRNVIKFAIPAVAIPISAAFNHYSTGAIGRMARQVYRDKAAAREAADRLGGALHADALLLLKLAYVAADVDGKVEAEEASFLHALTQAVGRHGQAGALDTFRGLVHIDRAQVIDEVADRPADVRALLYEAAAVMVAADHVVHTKERELLHELATRCGLRFDAAHLEQLAQRR